MTDLEYDVLDELYFVVSFRQLQDTLELEQDALRNVLQALLRRGWAKCFRDQKTELEEEDMDFARCYQEYFYLATKAGLLAHHGK